CRPAARCTPTGRTSFQEREKGRTPFWFSARPPRWQAPEESIPWFSWLDDLRQKRRNCGAESGKKSEKFRGFTPPLALAADRSTDIERVHADRPLVSRPRELRVVVGNQNGNALLGELARG